MIFTRKSLDWWQVGILKGALLLIGIAIGAYWPQAFISYIWWFLVVGILAGIYIGWVWIKEN